MVRTLGSQPGNRSSILRGGTTKNPTLVGFFDLKKNTEIGKVIAL